MLILKDILMKLDNRLSREKNCKSTLTMKQLYSIKGMLKYDFNRIK
jgi:hypothetical protein